MSMSSAHIVPADVHETLAKYMLADGMEMVLDLEKSKGATLFDARSGQEYIDFFSFFASQALGVNHPKLNNDEFKARLAAASVNKPSNSDVYTTYLAEFADTFGNIAKPDHFKYLFFVEGGSVAVENGLKVAFDWKVQKNFEKGYKEEKGTKVLHFKEAFHGRTGYTMSLTNTDPGKTRYFPKFEWPRVINPKITFPVEDNIEELLKLEEQAVSEIKAALKEHKDDIAVIIIEPIQGEGGDNFFRKEFFVKLREIADENDVLLMFDEVQTGLGLTGKMWASEHYVWPDIISFGKKVQVCGIMVSDRVDEVKDNVFNVSSRINSTWGGNLTDMVRSQRILEVIQEEKLVEHAHVFGNQLIGKLREMQAEFPEIISNARGLGLWAAVDFPDGATRNKFVSLAYEHRLAMLGCGAKTLRFRPPLTVTQEELDKGLNIMKNVLNLMK